MAKKATKSDKFGLSIVLNGKELQLRRHDTDISILGLVPNAIKEAEDDERLSQRVLADATETTPQMTRATVADPASRDEILDAARTETVAHHIYLVEGTDEEIIIDDLILLKLRHEDPAELRSIQDEFGLQYVRPMGQTHVLQVTEKSGRNPIKTANLIRERSTVESCSPQVLVPMVLFDAPTLSDIRFLERQWSLSAEMLSHPDVDPTAGINAPEAWEITRGDPSIVLAVLDDGFDLGHPAYTDKEISPAKRDFTVATGDADPTAERGDYHGTPVSSIAAASGQGGGMIGIAPGCTFLPVRIPFGVAGPVGMLSIFEYISQHADVVNCSFGISPQSFDVFPADFRQAISELTRTGGRRGRGLVIVFAAGNDDAPTYLEASKNVHGVRFVRPHPLFGAQLAEIPAGSDVFSGHPLTEGVIVVAAMSSRKRKSGFSNWGPHITVAAPSNNMHYITSFLPAGTPGRADFVANYRGLGQVGASNRPGVGEDFRPLSDDPTTLLRENFYTMEFGGTSGAAPVVAGVAALMLSANPALTAQQVRKILMATADQSFDMELDLANDPNLQGITGEFVGGRSAWFGSGKVDAYRAVHKARALAQSGPLLVTSTRARRQALRRRMPEIPQADISQLRVDLVPWENENLSNDFVGQWRVSPPHNGSLTDSFPEVRLWAISEDGRLLHEYKRATGLAASEPHASCFGISTASYPPQVGHSQYYSQLRVCDPQRAHEENMSLLIVTSGNRAAWQTPQPMPSQPIANQVAQHRSEQPVAAGQDAS